MNIATLLNVYAHPELVLDTVDSILTYVGNDILIVADAAGWDKFKGVKWPAGVDIIKGEVHSSHKSPHRNTTIGLREMYPRFPKADWYCFSESDCLFVSDRFKSDLNKNYAVLANDVRINDLDSDMVEFNEMVGHPVKTQVMVLGALLFYNKWVIKNLYESKMFDRVLEFTKDFPRGEFPHFDSWSFEEILYPTLAVDMGGTAKELGLWRSCNVWSNIKYLMRFRPEITMSELTSAILHPLKSYPSKVRTFFAGSREKLRKWNSF